MSMRRNVPRAAASCRTASRLSRQSSWSISSPSPLSFTDTLDSRPASSRRARTSWYWPAIVRASSADATSSPRTSIVASLPSPFSRPTTRSASSSVDPAMYRDDSRCTTGFGTAGSSWTSARSKRAIERGDCTPPAPRGELLLAHEALARGADERHRLGEEHAHRVAQRERLLVGPARDLHLRQRGGRQLDGGVQRQRRELLALCFLHGLRLLLGELAQPAEEILRIASERKAHPAFHSGQGSGQTRGTA